MNADGDYQRLLARLAERLGWPRHRILKLRRGQLLTGNRYEGTGDMQLQKALMELRKMAAETGSSIPEPATLNRRQQMVFAALTKTPPETDQHRLYTAYRLGFNNPSLSVENAGPGVGLPGSEARAAFMAGRAAAKRNHDEFPE